MAEFGLKKSFKIDDGQLDGLSMQECFVLGYELAQIDSLLAERDEISRPVHAENRERIATACIDAQRAFNMSWLPGDCSESWLLLEVQASQDEPSHLQYPS